MFKITLILFIISIDLFAMKAKVKQFNGDIVKVKAMFKSRMYGNGLEIKRKIKADYITNITVKANKQIILNLATTPNFSRNPLIKFTFKNYMKAEYLIFYITYNNGNQKEKSYKIYKKREDYAKREKDLKVKETVYKIEKDYRISNPKVFEKITINQAIKNLYGSKKPISGHIFIKVPKVARNGGLIPIEVKSDIDLESFSLFTDENVYPLIALVEFGKNKINNFKFSFKSKQGCVTLVAVGKGKDGKLYQETIISGINQFCDDYTKENCNDKKSKLAKTICLDWSLSKIDKKLTQYYEKLMLENILITSRKELLLQDNWKASRENECPSLDITCLLNYYNNRLIKLEKTYTKIYLPKPKKKRDYNPRDELDKLLAEGKIRVLTEDDLKRWAMLKKINYDKALKSPENMIPPVSEDYPSKSFRPKHTHNGYMVLEKITLPDRLNGGNLATFFIKEGVPYPDGDIGHSSIYEFDTMSSYGHFSLRERNIFPKWMKKKLKEDKQNICKFKNIKFDKNLKVFAGGGGNGKNTHYNIDNSNKGADLFDVVVNSPQDSVALFLWSQGPSIWNIKWTKGTKIEAVFATGTHSQIITGLPNSVPVKISTSSTNSGYCFIPYRGHNTLGKINILSEKIFNKKITMVYPIKNGNLFIGKKIHSDTKLYTSKEISLESFYNKSLPRAGQAGIDDYIKEGKIRLAKDADYDEFERITGQKARRHRTYIILDKISIPSDLYGGHSVTFYIKGNVPYPDGKLGHSTLWDFHNMMYHGVVSRHKIKKSEVM